MSEEAVRLNVSKLMRCKSPNLRLAWAASRRPPSKSASWAGHEGSERARSQAHKAARGRGRASTVLELTINAEG